MPPLKLDDAERADLRRAQQSLLSVLDRDDLVGWQLEANAAVKRLIGADRSVSSIPGAGPRSLLATDDAPPGFVDQFRAYLARPDPETTRLELRDGTVRHAQSARIRGGSGAYHMEELGPPGAHLSSPMYREVFEPYGFPYMVGLSTPLLGSEATQFFGFDRADAAGYSARGVELLGLLVPAFVGAVRIQHRLRRDRDRLARLFDDLGQPMALYAHDGSPLYRSRRLRALLEADPEPATVMAAADALAAGVTAGGRPGAPDRGPDPGVRRVRTAAGTWRLSVARTPTTLHRAAVVVLVEPASPRLPDPRVLQRRFGLTPRQADVARLMGYGLGDREIAERLTISWHTARRHARDVLGKLELSSRAAVAMTLLGGRVPESRTDRG